MHDSFVEWILLCQTQILELSCSMQEHWSILKLIYFYTITYYDKPDVNGVNNISQLWHCFQDKLNLHYLWLRVFSPHGRCLHGPVCQVEFSVNSGNVIIMYILKWPNFPLTIFDLTWPNTGILVTLVLYLNSSLKVVYTKLQESPHVHRTIGVVVGVTTGC